MINRLGNKVQSDARWLLRVTLLIGLTNSNLIYALHYDSFPEYEQAERAEHSIKPPIFKLTQGQGVDVCEAYFKRLQETEFHVSNFNLDKWAEPLIKRKEPVLTGFKELKTVPLTVDEVMRIYNKLVSFQRYRDQDRYKKYYENHKRDKNFQELGQSFSRESLSMLTKIPMERYRTKLDLDNDGDITDTIIKSTSLVSVSANVRIEVDGLFIVDKQLQQVEEAKMHDIFADKEILEWPSVAHFPPLAAPIDLFVYKGKTYFDGFINISFFGRSPTVDRHVPAKLGVFIHEYGQTRKICECEWVNGEVYPYIYINKPRLMD